MSYLIAVQGNLLFSVLGMPSWQTVGFLDGCKRKKPAVPIGWLQFQSYSSPEEIPAGFI